MSESCERCKALEAKIKLLEENLELRRELHQYHSAVIFQLQGQLEALKTPEE